MIIQIQYIEHLSYEQRQSLSLLYGPLIGKSALCLYYLLQSIDKTMELEEIKLVLHLNDAQFERSRNHLEQYHLIETYIGKDTLLVRVLAALMPEAFLSHDTYSRLYLAHVGMKVFDQVKLMLQKDKTIPEQYTKVESPLDVSSLDAWSEAKEIAYEKVKPTMKQKYDFDFQTLFRGMDRVFPMRYRTSENLDRIAQLAKIYGVSAKDMRKYVFRSIDSNKNAFDVKKLESWVRSNRKVEKAPKDMYQMAPVQFLRNKQNGIPVVKTDQILIDKLCTQFQFPNEVVNTLIEYTLKQTNQQFSKNYVEKVAASWVRLHVDSRQKALEVINQDSLTYKKASIMPKQDLDEKFYEKKEEKTLEELQQETLELQKKLKEGKL